MKQFTTISRGMAEIFMLCMICSFSVKAQINREACHTILHDRTYEQMRQEVDVIRRFHKTLRGRGEAASIDTVPVYFSVFRNDDGSFADPAVDEALTDQALDELNQYFAPMRLHFQRLGEINYIDHTGFTDFRYHHHLQAFSYVSTALNVYTKSGSGSFAQFPAMVAPEDESSLYDISKNRSNMLTLNSSRFLSTTFAHEMGHSYGLLHTFEGARVYNNPKSPTPGFTGSFTDHPYGENGNIRRRELVIRQPDLTKDFPQPNSVKAGDFVDDTPAFCVSTTMFPSYYPDRSEDACESYPFDKQTCNGCIVVDCNYEGDYVDYNGDTLINTQVSIKNIMSYTSCRSEFTPGQYDRMRFYHENVRKLQYDAGLDINYSDTVFFEDSKIPMDDILLQFSHPNQFRYSHATTNSQGKFQAIFYEGTGSVNILKAGTALDPTYKPSPWVQASVEEIINKSYQTSDWTDGVDAQDLALLEAHLQGEYFLNGYHQIAADLNGDGQLSQADAQILQQLISGDLHDLEEFDSPWRFLPAGIPYQYPTEFHNNPFNMEINGVAYEAFAPYLEADWELALAQFSAGSGSFHAVKLGDLNGSSLRPEAPEEVPTIEPEVTEPTEPVATTLNTMTNMPGKTKLTCFPNPTQGDMTIEFNAGVQGMGKIMITDSFLRPLYQKDIQLNEGLNQLPIIEDDLPNGIILITLKTDEGVFYRKVSKVAG